MLAILYKRTPAVNFLLQRESFLVSFCVQMDLYLLNNTSVFKHSGSASYSSSAMKRL